ncbi:MAG TPA: cupin domain-containing protein [Noviherbaspirillum sp.]|jgi:gentisate 1,2-dioxygenase|uniref:cupin domain-containing protein n=1 Tax=Noviherbaspirillum sp. TaxID=1926288 RepID=UPI002F91EC5B
MSNTETRAAGGPSVDFAAAGDLESLYALLDEVRMKNGWAKPTPSIYPEPKQFFVPAHWRYADARAALHAAGRLVGTEWAERRNLIMANPIPGNDYATTRTMVGAYQMVKGGESARSHRHTPNAMRIVLEAAPDTYTIVEGKKIPMLPGDVLLTPNWQYHGHANESAQDSYWIDVLDAPLVQYLGPMFFNVHPDRLEPASGTDPASPMRFAFADYRPALVAAPEVAPGVRTLELGADSLPTMGRTAVHLAAQSTWDHPRTTANQIFAVVAGQGTAQLGDRSVAWSKGDMLVVPSWNPHSFHADEEAVLLCISDAPVMRAMGWLKVEPR